MRRQAFFLVLLVLVVVVLVGCGKGGRAPAGEGQARAGSESAVGGAAPAGTEAVVSVREIKDNPARFKDRPVRVRGYGTIVAEVLLCPGYVGLDTRCRFVDEAKDMIVARVSDELAKSGSATFKEGNPRLFRGYVRVFNGEIGCPGNLRKESFPWLEIVAVE